MGYQVKAMPDDFIVRENASPELGSGRYACYRLSKRGWTTGSAIGMVSRAFGKRSKFINFAGNKDKQAVTEQFITILHGPKRGLELDQGNVRLDYLGQTRERMNLGSAQGNEFEITVRNLGPGEKSAIPPAFPNYFDEQRFGMNKNNHITGRHIIRREFEQACALIPETREWLEKSPRDYVGALRSLPKRVLRIYPHAYQSWLWNTAASEEISRHNHREVSWTLGNLAFPEEGLDNREIPVPGYESPRDNGGIMQGMLENDGIERKDFRLPQFPEFDLKGGERDLLMEPEGLDITKPEDDELNPGKHNVLVRFSLGKGSYATMVIRAIFS